MMNHKLMKRLYIHSVTYVVTFRAGRAAKKEVSHKGKLPSLIVIDKVQVLTSSEGVMGSRAN